MKYFPIQKKKSAYDQFGHAGVQGMGGGQGGGSRILILGTYLGIYLEMFLEVAALQEEQLGVKIFNTT